MAAQIRPNRLEVTDRFPMLGFTIRTDGSPSRAEVALATDPTLFRAERKGARTTATFYSSRSGGPLLVPRGEAVYVLPPEVLARFIGQERLYVALATTPDRNGNMPRVDVLPTEGSPYISLKGLTGRSLRRVRVLPTRQQRQAGYGGDNGASLEWAGDSATPGVVPVGTNGNGKSNGHAPAVAARPTTPIEYDDGFGPLEPASRVASPPQAASPAPSPAPLPTPAPPSPASETDVGSAPAAVAKAFDLSNLTLAPESRAVTPPPVRRLSTTEELALQGALALLPPPLGVTLSALRAAAQTAGVSIGVGPGVSAGLLAGAGLGAGVIFGKDGDLGAYGSAELQVGLIASISATAQVTVVRGGIDSFNGWSHAYGISGGEGIVGGGAALFDTNGNFQGISVQIGVGAGLSPVDIYVALQRQVATALALAHAYPGMQARGFVPSAGALGVAVPAGTYGRGLNVDAATVDLKFRMFIPSPLVAGPVDFVGVFGGDGRGFSFDQGTSRGEINARVHLSPGGGINSISVFDRHWGESTEYDAADAIAVPGKPEWWRDKRQGATPRRRETLQVTDNNLRVYAGSSSTTLNIETTIEQAVIVTFSAEGSNPLAPGSPAIDAELSVMIRFNSGSIEAKVVGEHDGFPAYEIYANGNRLYAYDPAGAGNDPSALMPTMDITARTNWTTVGSSTATAQALSAPRPRALQQQQPEYPYASRFVPAASSNYRATTGTRTIDRVVVHITDGGANIDGTIAWFQDPAAEVSAHYVIGRDGEIVQMVRHNDVAYHARSANSTSIGIEHVANTRGLDVTEAQYNASAALVVWLCQTFNIPKDRQHILGHREAVQTTKTCPGNNWNWDYYMDLIINEYCRPMSVAAAVPPSYALEHESFTINWDDVQAVPQPNDVTCWAAAAAMVVGWKELQSLDPATVAQIARRTTATGLDPAQVGQFAKEIGLVAQPPQSYSVDGFRQLLESKGPLWVGAAVPGLHAIVVTGMYSGADGTFVRITDPWDREVGAPGSPGAYLQTHATGSRYIMRWEDFVREYETAATNFSSVNLQILHAAEVPAGRTANYGSAAPVGYAQSLRAARGRAVAAGARRYAGGFNDAAGPVGAAPAPGPAEPAAPVRRVDTGTSGDTRWSLEQYAGLRRPAVAPTEGPQISHGGDRTVRLDDWPLIQLADGVVQLPLTVSWRHNAGAVGDVAIRAGEVRSVPGWTLSATAEIAEGTDTGSTSSLVATIRYVFGRTGHPDIVAVSQLTLFGDGTYQRQDRWVTD